MTARTKYLVVLLASLALVASGCGSKDKGTDDGNGDAAAGAECTYVDSGSEPARKVTKPPSSPAEHGPVDVTMETNFGKAPMTLDAKKAPCAVNSFLSLSEQGYYDKTDCSRVAFDSRGFAILQCGDPTGTGGGDPGYRFAEEVDGTEKYTSGVVAMAKGSQPATTGGQFFVVLGDTQLGPEYTIFGKLSDQGLQVFRKAGTAALKGKKDGYDGPPATKVTITKVTQP